LKIVVLGSGAREDAIARALEWGRDARSDEVIVAPGNAGSTRRLRVDICDPAAVVAMCRSEGVDLVVVGPETALEAGVTDALVGEGVPVFGPSRAAARLETSKSHCREMAGRWGIPQPEAKSFSGDHATSDAIDWARTRPFDVVVKADGLAAGKGVVVPTDAAERDDAIRRLAARGPVLLEEKMTGDEVSVLAFVDGTTVAVMPPAQDHKRVGEADTGPNTGGMGAYAPTSLCPPEMLGRIESEILLPAVRGLAAEGTPYVGVLYAGVMLSVDGPRLVEFNCRFGDPEAQVLLPLLDTDLKEVLLACVEGRLASAPVRWRQGATCGVVLAAEGYPADPRVGDPIEGLESAADAPDVEVFHAGTDMSGDRVVTAGGRVLCVSAWGVDLVAARDRAYATASRITFPGRVMRRDIGWREIARTSGGYRSAGVDIDEGNRAVELLRGSVEATHGAAVIGGVGSFGGVFSLEKVIGMDDPVLVASTDGIGTKVMIAAETGRYSTIGHDIVNHCVNDVLVQRARPLFFLDYVASASIRAEVVAAIVASMAEACAANDCALLGGETAEMPGVYAPGHFDVAGTLVGVAERSQLLPRPDVAPGDVLLGLSSSGLHTNGYSLARRILAGLPLEATPPGWDGDVASALLASHRSYLGPLGALLDTDLPKALVHVTGGGVIENVPRVLPDGCGARVDTGTWARPAIFDLLAEVSGLDAVEMHRTFNMGIGMVVVVAPGDLEAARDIIDEETFVIGEITQGHGVVLA
jgi:phosphoribosylamine--glycine ligase/phosphoribosylaminoimidazole synthetase